MCYAATQDNFNLVSKFGCEKFLYFPIFYHFFSPKKQLFIGIQSISKKTRLKRARQLKKLTIYIIIKFSLNYFLIIFLSQKWFFIEGFIDHTSFNLIFMHVLINVPKKKPILTTLLGTEPKAYGHFNQKKIFNTFIRLLLSVKNICIY